MSYWLQQLAEGFKSITFLVKILDQQSAYQQLDPTVDLFAQYKKIIFKCIFFDKKYEVTFNQKYCFGYEWKIFGYYRQTDGRINCYRLQRKNENS